MANKLAPYRDPAVLATIERFNNEYKVQAKEYGVFSKQTTWPMYRHYLKWIAGQDDDALLATTLNKPQFDKAFHIYMLIYTSGKQVSDVATTDKT